MPKGGVRYALLYAVFPALRGHPLTPGMRFAQIENERNDAYRKQETANPD
jgi:hypothetical protein